MRFRKDYKLLKKHKHAAHMLGNAVYPLKLDTSSTH
jgi:hypothetical protein